MQSYDKRTVCTLADGRLTDNKGRVADFKNTIIIMTSNLGSNIIQENYANPNGQSNDEVFQKTKAELNELLKKTLKPEFLNRIDEIVMFQPLSKREIKDIINLQLDNLRKLLAQRNLNIEFSDYAMKLLADLGYDPMFGARPLKRVIQKQIMNELSKLILSDDLGSGDTIVVDSMEDGKFVFYKK